MPAISPTIADTAELISIVGASANGSIHIEDIQPDIDQVEEDIIVPLLGMELRDYIKSGVFPIFTEIFFPLLKRAVAYLSLYRFSLHASVQLSSNGMMRLEGDGVRASFRYQESDYQAYTLTTGWEAVEKLLLSIEYQKHDVVLAPAWNDTIQSTTQGHLLNYASTMRRIYHTRISRVIFEMMRPVIHEVEYYLIRPLITPSFYNVLMNYIENKWTSGARPIFEQALLLAQHAIVHMVIRECVLREWVRIDRDGIVAITSGSDQSSVSRTPANNYQLNVMVRTHEDWARRVIQPLMTYLGDNAVELGYIPPVVPTVEPSADCCPDRWPCTCRGTCTCSSHRRTVISL